MKILIGFVIGVVVATVGFSGVARMADNGVTVVKEQAQKLGQ